jgi:hypothetical protein
VNLMESVQKLNWRFWMAGLRNRSDDRLKRDDGKLTTSQSRFKLMLRVKI